MSFCFPLISLQICKEKRSNISAINQSKKTVDIQNIQIEKTRKTEKQQKYIKIQLILQQNVDLFAFIIDYCYIWD